MSTNLRANFYKLELISQLKNPKARKVLMTEFSKDVGFCKAVREIVKNTVKRNVRVSDRERTRLLKYKNLILSIAKKQKDHKRTRKLVQQTGTGVILPILVPLVAAIISSLTSK